MRRNIRGFFFILLFVLSSGQGGEILNTYPLAWNTVPTTPFAKNLTSNCVCDLTAFACDPGCCCDPYCLTAVVSATRAQQACLPEGPPDQTLDFCVPSKIMQKVNLPSSGDYYSVTVQAADEKFFDQLLCIDKSSNPNLGSQFTDPAPGNPGNQAACPPQQSDPTRSLSYIPGSPVFVTSPLNPSVSRPLTVPFPAFSQECVDDYQPGFLLPTPSGSQDIFTQCTRDISDAVQLAAKCSDSYGAFSAFAYASLTFLSLPATSSNAASLVTPQLLFLDPATGVLTDAPALPSLLNPPSPPPVSRPPSPNPNPPSPPTPVPPSPSPPAPPLGSPPVPSPPPGPPSPAPAPPSPSPPSPPAATSLVYYSNNTCYNALKYINITLVYSSISAGDTTTLVSTMQLTQVQMSLVVTNVPSSAGSFNQLVRVNYVQNTVGTVGSDPFPVQPLSGNPGYLTGFPLLVGYNASFFTFNAGQKKAISRLTFGLPMPIGSSDGSCKATSLAPVKFGYNTTSSCTVSVTQANLQSYCTLPNQTFFLRQILGQFVSQLEAKNVTAGIWGNSNWTNTDEWIQVVSSNPVGNPNYNPSTGVCSNAIVGFDIQILTGVAFSANNVQRKVLYVNMCYRSGTWTFPPTANPLIARNFFMTSTANFTALPQTPNGKVMKPTPPLALPLPEDIFYPFVTSEATVARPVANAAVMLALAVALANLVLMS